MKGRIVLLVAVLAFSLGCGHKTAANNVPPPPGATDSFDAGFYRAIADAQAAIHSVKTWQQCTTHDFPLVLNVDGKDENCDRTNGPFPPNYNPVLNGAIQSYNAAAQFGAAYHAGAASLQETQAAVNKMNTDVKIMTQQMGGK